VGGFQGVVLVLEGFEGGLGGCEVGFQGIAFLS